VQQLESVARSQLRSHSLTTAVAVASDCEGGQLAMAYIHMYHHPFFRATFSCVFFCRSHHHVHCAANPAKKKKKKDETKENTKKKKKKTKKKEKLAAREHQSRKK
jgi:hypothetical protein